MQTPEPPAVNAEGRALSRGATGLILGAAAVAWLFSLPFVSVFTWFSTLVHEAGHALAVELVGGDVQTVTINRYGGGLTTWSAPADIATWRLVLIASAGYLSAVGVGVGLLVVALRARSPRAALIGTGVAVWLTALLWVPWTAPRVDAVSAAASGASAADGRFTILFTLLVGAALIALAFAPRAVGQAALLFLAAICLLSALDSLRELWGVASRGSHSDATIAGELTGLPAWLWALVWIAMSGAVAWWAALRLMGKSESSASP